MWLVHFLSLSCADFKRQCSVSALTVEMTFQDVAHFCLDWQSSHINNMAESADKAGTQRKCETEEQQDKSVENQEIDRK